MNAKREVYRIFRTERRVRQRTVLARFVWRLRHPGHPRYRGGPWTDHLRGLRCAMPSGHEGFCRCRSGFGWENRW